MGLVSVFVGEWGTLVRLLCKTSQSLFPEDVTNEGKLQGYFSLLITFHKESKWNIFSQESSFYIQTLNVIIAFSKFYPTQNWNNAYWWSLVRLRHNCNHSSVAILYQTKDNVLLLRKQDWLFSKIEDKVLLLLYLSENIQVLSMLTSGKAETLIKNVA